MEGSVITSLATSVLVIILPALAAMAAELLRRKLGVEKMAAIQRELETKQDLGVLAVRFAEQAYRDYDGDVKYNAAAKYLAKQASVRGLKISEQEIQGLIESSIRTLKENFSDAWSKSLTKELD